MLRLSSSPFRGAKLLDPSQTLHSLHVTVYCSAAFLRDTHLTLHSCAQCDGSLLPRILSNAVFCQSPWKRALPVYINIFLYMKPLCLYIAIFICSFVGCLYMISDYFLLRNALAYIHCMKQWMSLQGHALPHGYVATYWLWVTYMLLLPLFFFL